MVESNFQSSHGRLKKKKKNEKPVDNSPRTEFAHKCVLVAQSCLTLRDCMNCPPPDSSVHGILQARILEWVAIPFSRGSS